MTKDLATFRLSDLDDEKLDAILDRTERDDRGQRKIAVRVVAMLTGCQVRIPKKDPTKPPFAILSVDDGTGKTDAFAFSKVYEKHKWISEYGNKPLLLCGEICRRLDELTSRDTGAAQFIVREAYPLDEGIVKFSRAVKVRFQYDDPLLAERIAALKLLAYDPLGKLKVDLELAYHDGTVVTMDLGAAAKIAPSAEFLAAFGEKLGKRSYRFEVTGDIYLDAPKPRWNSQKR